MTEITPADLSPHPAVYQSSRQKWDVLIGEDTIRPIIEASSSGDILLLRGLLTQEPWKANVLQSSHIIYHEDRPPASASDVRGILAAKWPNLIRSVYRAAEMGHAAVVETLLEYGAQNGVSPSLITHIPLVKMVVMKDDASVLEKLCAADPTMIDLDFGPNGTPLALAEMKNKPGVAAVLRRLGASNWHPRR